MEEQIKAFNLFDFTNTVVKPIYLKVRKWLFIPPLVFFLAFAFGYWKESKTGTTYHSKITYMLENDILGEKNASAGSGSLLAAISGQTATGNKEVMIDLGLSHKLIEQTLLSTAIVDQKKVLLVNYYIENNRLGGNFKTKPAYDINYEIGGNKDLDYWLRVFSSQIKRNIKSFQAESGLYVMELNSQNELFAKVFLENHLTTISDFYSSKKMERSMAMVKLAKRKRDSILYALQGRTYSAASINDNLFGAVKKTARVTESQAIRDVAIVELQYSESVITLDAASMDMQRRKPLFAVVDDIRLPLESESPKSFKKGMTLGLIGLILGLVLLVGYFLGIDYLKQQKLDYIAARK